MAKKLTGDELAEYVLSLNNFELVALKGMLVCEIEKRRLELEIAGKEAEMARIEERIRFLVDDPRQAMGRRQ